MIALKRLIPAWPLALLTACGTSSAIESAHDSGSRAENRDAGQSERNPPSDAAPDTAPFSEGFHASAQPVLGENECRDPEFLFPYDWAPCFDGSSEPGSVVLREFDTSSGLPTGETRVVDPQANALVWQGPELALGGGLRVVSQRFEDGSARGRVNIFMSGAIDPVPEAISLERLTNCHFQCRLSVASKNCRTESVGVVVNVLEGPDDAGSYFYAFSSEPTQLKPFPIKRVRRKASWLPGTDDILYIGDIGDEKNAVILDTSTGRARMITEPGTHGEFIMALPLIAPEYGGETLVAVLEDYSRVQIYRDTGGAYWSRVHEITSPDPERPHLQFFATIDRLADECLEAPVAWPSSYITFQASAVLPPGFSNTSIWISDLDSNLQRRVDDGATTGRVATRWDAEILVTRDQVASLDRFYVLYAESEPDGRGPRQLWRAETGLAFPVPR